MNLTSFTFQCLWLFTFEMCSKYNILGQWMLCAEDAVTLDPDDWSFFFCSVILSEWRGRQRNHHCLTCPRCVPSAPYLYSLTLRYWLYFSFFPLTLSRPSFLCCRILLQMNLPPTHRMTTPQMRRSWPPPPVISGLLLMTWMQIWTLTNKTSLSHVTLHPLLMRTVSLIRL